MKLIFSILAILLAICHTSALNHRVGVWLVRPSGDPGNSVEVKTTVTFKYPSGNIVRSSTMILPKSEDFVPGFGAPLLDTTFNGNPLDMTLRVYEYDGGSGNDGICYLLFRPHYVVGHVDYLCIREADNGLQDTWKVRMRINMS